MDNSLSRTAYLEIFRSLQPYTWRLLFYVSLPTSKRHFPIYDTVEGLQGRPKIGATSPTLCGLANLYKNQSRRQRRIIEDSASLLKDLQVRASVKP